MIRSLRAFDQDRIAKLDLRMWRAYYGHNFARLFFLLVALVRVQFGLNYVRAVQAAFLAASAAIDFRINKGHEDQAKILRKLTRFSKLVSEYSLERFDFKKVAELELNWWFIDRYPERYPSGAREEGLREAMAAMYRIDPERLNDYARYRAAAMVLQDEAEKRGEPVDWERIAELLKHSYASLYEAVK